LEQGLDALIIAGSRDVQPNSSTSIDRPEDVAKPNGAVLVVDDFVDERLECVLEFCGQV